jgi:hypothetical protein
MARSKKWLGQLSFWASYAAAYFHERAKLCVTCFLWLSKEHEFLELRNCVLVSHHLTRRQGPNTNKKSLTISYQAKAYYKPMRLQFFLLRESITPSKYETAFRFLIVHTPSGAKC